MVDLVVCVTGMPGAGKSTVAEAARKLGFKVVNMGDAVREEAARRGLGSDGQSMTAVMFKLREELGPYAVAKLCVEHIGKFDARWILVDGVRSTHEVKLFRSKWTVKLLAVHAPPDLRYNFLKGRARGDAPSSLESFEERDRNELKVGVGDAVSLSDHTISNVGISVHELQREAGKVIEKWMREAGSETIPASD